MPGEPQPLFSNQAIVDANGFPTQYFIRWAQQRQKDITAGITSDQAQAIVDDWGGSHQVHAGTGLAGGGALEGNPTLELAATAVDPGTYGDATHVAKFTVDADGRITDAEDVAISGGGGGGGPGAIGMYQMPGANIPGNTSDTAYPGLTFTFTPPTAGLFKIEWFFFYFGGHRIRFAPRMDSARLAGIADDDWFSGFADEHGAYKGTASIVMPLTAAAHTADLVYNVMDSTDGMTAVYSYITVTPIAAAF